MTRMDLGLEMEMKIKRKRVSKCCFRNVKWQKGVCGVGVGVIDRLVLFIFIVLLLCCVCE